jgi:hypothetical protein
VSLFKSPELLQKHAQPIRKPSSLFVFRPCAPELCSAPSQSLIRLAVRLSASRARLCTAFRGCLAWSGGAAHTSSRRCVAPRLSLFLADRLEKGSASLIQRPPRRAPFKSPKLKERDRNDTLTLRSFVFREFYVKSCNAESVLEDQELNARLHRE